MKKHLVLAIVATATAAIGAGADPGLFLASKLDEWFAQAKPVGQGLWVTDNSGCLYMVTNQGNSLRVVPMLDAAKKPVCRK